jgi:hypothetical protein
VVLAPAAVLIRRRRLQRDAEPSDELSELGVVRASIAALESEHEPRRAVLRAYVQMENAFKDIEVERAASRWDTQTPLAAVVEELASKR